MNPTQSVVELFAVVIVFAIFAIDLVSTLAELISAEESQEKVAHIFLFEIRGSHDSNERKVKVVCTTSTQKSPPERTHPRSIICFIRRKAVRVLDSKVNGYCDLPESLVTQVWMQQISTIFFCLVVRINVRIGSASNVPRTWWTAVEAVTATGAAQGVDWKPTDAVRNGRHRLKTDCYVTKRDGKLSCWAANDPKANSQ